MNFSSGANVLIMEIKDVVKRELHILETYLRTLQKYVLFCVISDIYSYEIYVSICTLFPNI